MATTTLVQEPNSKALKCQTWVLKVSIHCQGCRRKVKKILLDIDGVYTAIVDSQQQRVTVTGNIQVETLIKKLIKTGKHAEIWPEKLPSEERESGKTMNTHKQNDPMSSQDSSNNGKKKSVQFGDETKDVGKSPENANPTGRKELPTVKNTDSESEGGSGVKVGGKKKKNKGQKGENGSSRDSGSASPSPGAAAGTGYQTQGVGMTRLEGPGNLSPARQQSVNFPQGSHFPQVHASIYSMAYPREYPGPFFYVPPSPYPGVTLPLDSFFYFSDDNVHGCSIM